MAILSMAVSFFRPRLRSGPSRIRTVRMSGQAHVSALMTGRRGKRVGYEIGLRLLVLHRDRCKEVA